MSRRDETFSSRGRAGGETRTLFIAISSVHPGVASVEGVAFDFGCVAFIDAMLGVDDVKVVAVLVAG